jgi:hypothetical protein
LDTRISLQLRDTAFILQLTDLDTRISLQLIDTLGILYLTD